MTRAAAEKLVVVPGVLTAFKVARLVTGPNGYAFEGLGMGGMYGPHDLAVCVHREHHVPPVRHCGCGFYALKDRDRAVGLINHVGVALLDVDLWGRFEEYRRGFRAAVQQVRRVTLLPYCIPCLYGHAHVLTGAQVLSGGREPHHELVPVCGDHLDPDRRAVTPAELAVAFGVEVVWADGDDALLAVAAETARVLRPRRPPEYRRLDDLAAGETGHVFQNAIAIDFGGRVWVDPLARLVQPLAGTDVPIRLGDDGVVELLLDQVTDFDGWRPRHDPQRHARPARDVTTEQ